MITNVLIDLDNTIFDFSAAEAVALRRVLSDLGIEPTEDAVALYSRINREQWERMERGEVSRDIVLITRYELFFRALGIEKDPVAAEKQYERYLSIGHYYMPHAEEFLGAIRQKYRIYLASNGIREIQRGRLASAGLLDFFDAIFISSEIGFNKPDKSYFDACFSKMEDPRKEVTVMIGDSLTSDVKGGKNAGIRTIYYNPQKIPNETDCKPDFEVSDLLEILPILERI